MDKPRQALCRNAFDLAEQPLVVRAGRTTVRTDGGAVAVRAYPDEPTAAVFVRDGEASVRTAAGSETVGAGRAVQIAADGRITAVTAKEQRQLAQAVKRARELALLPYVTG